MVVLTQSMVRYKLSHWSGEWLSLFILNVHSDHFKRSNIIRTENYLLALPRWLVATLILLLVKPVDSQSALERLQYWFPHVNFNRPRIGDLLRILLQICWLLTFRPTAVHKKAEYSYIGNRWRGWQFARAEQEREQAQELTQELLRETGVVEPAQWQKKTNRELTQELPKHWEKVSQWIAGYPFSKSRVGRYCYYLLAAILTWFCITTPFSLAAQLLFALLLFIVALWVRRYRGAVPGLVLITLSAVATSRYIWWRCTSTLNWDDNVDLAFGLILLFAEFYACLILVLGYFQTAWPLTRPIRALPSDSSTWPSVDIYIPTYNEPLSVVKPTVYAALAIDWPQKKLNVYILDDGNRQEFKEFAAISGAGYIVRAQHTHAKAGNLNHAMTITQGDFITIFDCDHIPTRSFLQITMGWFLHDDKLALVQSPHHFFSADPFEKNLQNFRDRPNENELFYGLCQDGNDLWDAVFFCGSCAILKRGPLLEVGGIAIETVTEDAHTALKLHRLGYHSAYIKIPQAAGLATESLSAHVGQRIRWARGMTQIFRLDNPMSKGGLSFAQRICYTNAMLHFLNGLPRMIFLTAPLAFLLFNAYIIYAPAVTIALYVIPHLVHSSISNSRMQGNYRRSFWAEMYETVLAWYILWPSLVALFAPSKGKFNVTVKGGVIDKNHFDWSTSKPYLILISLNLLGLVFGLYRIFFSSGGETSTIILNLAWTVYNLIILGGAVAVAEETRQVRRFHRVEFELPAIIQAKDGKLLQCEIVDYSEGGLGIKVHSTEGLQIDDELTVIMKLGKREFAFPSQIINLGKARVGVRFDKLSQEQERDLILCTFARADAWVNWNEGRTVDRPLESLREIIDIGIKGYGRLFHYLTPHAPALKNQLMPMMNFIKSFLPQPPRVANAY